MAEKHLSLRPCRRTHPSLAICSQTRRGTTGSTNFGVAREATTALLGEVAELKARLDAFSPERGQIRGPHRGTS